MVLQLRITFKNNNAMYMLASCYTSNEPVITPGQNNNIEIMDMMNNHDKKQLIAICVVQVYMTPIVHTMVDYSFLSSKQKQKQSATYRKIWKHIER